MTNANPSRLGQMNQTGDENSLFQKVFAGEVMTAFDESNIMMDKHQVRTIKQGKSAQFPAIGKISAQYHTPGNEILGSNVNHAERVIVIDDLLYADAFISQIDEVKNHYDVRAPYSTAMGNALGLQFDKNVFQVGVLAARSSSAVKGLPGGSELSHDDFKTNADKLAEAIFDAGQKLDEKDVPDDGNRHIAFLPFHYNLLVRSTTAINRDWGGSGAYSEGTVLKINGFNVHKSNNIPTTNISTGPASYQGDFSKTLALCWHKSAMGTVKLLDLAMENDYDIRRQGTLMIAKYALGHGILRPECAVELKSVT